MNAGGRKVSWAEVETFDELPLNSAASPAAQSHVALGLEDHTEKDIYHSLCGDGEKAAIKS